MDAGNSLGEPLIPQGLRPSSRPSRRTADEAQQMSEPESPPGTEHSSSSRLGHSRLGHSRLGHSRLGHSRLGHSRPDHSRFGFTSFAMVLGLVGLAVVLVTGAYRQIVTPYW